MIRIDIDEKPVTQGSMSAIPYHRPCPECLKLGGVWCGRAKVCIPGTRGNREIGCNVVQDGAVKTWRAMVAIAAKVAFHRESLMTHPVFPTGGVVLATLFRLQRPQGYTNSRGNALSADGTRNPDPWHKPDVDKLDRAIRDALTGVAYTDDAQVVMAPSAKVWSAIGKPPSVTILIAAKARGMTFATVGAALDALIPQEPVLELFPA